MSTTVAGLLRISTLLFLIAVAATPRAYADVTVFTGVTSPAARPVFGVAVGKCLTTMCFEADISYSNENASAQAPALSSIGFSLLVPFLSPTQRLRLHAAAGAGGYDEIGDFADTGAGSQRNVGGGARFQIYRALHARLDYRMFFLGEPDGGELYARHVHRFTAGLSIPW